MSLCRSREQKDLYKLFRNVRRIFILCAEIACNQKYMAGCFYIYSTLKEEFAD